MRFFVDVIMREHDWITFQWAHYPLRRQRHAPYIRTFAYTRRVL